MEIGSDGMDPISEIGGFEMPLIDAAVDRAGVGFDTRLMFFLPN